MELKCTARRARTRAETCRRCPPLPPLRGWSEISRGIPRRAAVPPAPARPRQAAHRLFVIVDVFISTAASIRPAAPYTRWRSYSNKAVVIRLSLDFDSIRFRFDCDSTAFRPPVRPFDDRRHDRDCCACAAALINK